MPSRRRYHWPLSLSTPPIRVKPLAPEFIKSLPSSQVIDLTSPPPPPPPDFISSPDGEIQEIHVVDVTSSTPSPPKASKTQAVINVSLQAPVSPANSDKITAIEVVDLTKPSSSASEGTEEFEAHSVINLTRSRPSPQPAPPVPRPKSSSTLNLNPRSLFWPLEPPPFAPPGSDYDAIVTANNKFLRWLGRVLADPRRTHFEAAATWLGHFYKDDRAYYDEGPEIAIRLFITGLEILEDLPQASPSPLLAHIHQFAPFVVALHSHRDAFLADESSSDEGEGPGEEDMNDMEVNEDEDENWSDDEREDDDSSESESESEEDDDPAELTQDVEAVQAPALPNGHAYPFFAPPPRYAPPAEPGPEQAGTNDKESDKESTDSDDYYLYLAFDRAFRRWTHLLIGGVTRRVRVHPRSRSGSPSHSDSGSERGSSSEPVSDVETDSAVDLSPFEPFDPSDSDDSDSYSEAPNSPVTVSSSSTPPSSPPAAAEPLPSQEQEPPVDLDWLFTAQVTGAPFWPGIPAPSPRQLRNHTSNSAWRPQAWAAHADGSWFAPQAPAAPGPPLPQQLQSLFNGSASRPAWPLTDPPSLSNLPALPPQQYVPSPNDFAIAAWPNQAIDHYQGFPEPPFPQGEFPEPVLGQQQQQPSIPGSAYPTWPAPEVGGWSAFSPLHDPPHESNANNAYPPIDGYPSSDAYHPNDTDPLNNEYQPNDTHPPDIAYPSSGASNSGYVNRWWPPQ